MKKEITLQATPKKDLKSLSNIQPLTEGQAAELKGGYYSYSYSYSYASCCTDKRRPIRVGYWYY
jgi:hypothetical protein